MTKYLYFAYGSNLNLKQMRKRCPNAQFLEQGSLPGWKLTFRGPLDIERKKGHAVQGGVFLLSQQDLMNLDAYEGFPRYYTRKYVTVQVGEERKIKCLVYFMTAEYQAQEASPPSQRYFQVVREGYRNCKLMAHIDGLNNALIQSFK